MCFTDLLPSGSNSFKMSLLSNRGTRVVTLPDPSYEPFKRCLANPYSPDNPTGNCNLATANNRLTWPLIAERVNISDVSYSEFLI